MNIRIPFAAMGIILCATTAGASDATADYIPKMQSHVEQMQQQMHELQGATTTQARQEILRQHMRTLREHMHETCAAADFACDGSGNGAGDCGCTHHREMPRPGKSS